MMYDRCFICGTTRNLQTHHVFGGGRRRSSDRYGCLETLCIEHHTGSNYSVHQDASLSLVLKQKHQKRLMDEGMSVEEFIRIFGKSYLDRNFWEEDTDGEA
ncbi:MAG: hypothetical protein FWG40_00845 [Peptococcaceae bacterium]|nr:hypothetical protein [Peptococcaceae bacterium]